MTTKRDQSIKARLEAAYEIAQYSGEAYAAMAHDFACHYDGSDCGLGSEVEIVARAARDNGCVADRENLDMLALAKEYATGMAAVDVDGLKRLWAQRLVNQ